MEGLELSEPVNYQEDRHDETAASLNFPIFQSSAYVMPKGEKYRYTRESNPTVENLAIKISALEGTEKTTCFSSGMGAVFTTLFTILKPGSTLVIHRDMFSRTYRLSTDLLGAWGVKTRVADPGTDNLLEAIESGADLVLVEAITNPILRVNDIGKIATRIHSQGGLLAVDSTIATPYNLNPASLGADIVLHSVSKYISGNNDAIGGACSGQTKLIDRIDSMRRTTGPSMDPFTAFLVNQGIKTLDLRMKRINSNAERIAEAISHFKGIQEVYYPGLPSHPDHRIAREMLKGYSGIVTFKSRNSIDLVSLFKKLRTIIPANTLGGVGTIISHPATMSHRNLSAQEREKLGITDTMFRLSVGIEDPDLILKDLEVFNGH